ncbi:hypothetical protein LGL55_10560 [Clostridium tagluense]|uniref:hypothetical protein n=1 Tax=Clostridium tagluense TaxID=360422 RepID=UPI001CF2D862|nr:hypothetical protein [Clostridium tagluense]MCB2311619.1 hypothetical protein [Clostridium tagluense]MCB2316343.1 hypothetical protein [Clostridium tagluense]MCB2321273.1 hypothetical protein [Clostridium tagluense]MCB2326212.1 hypothetical protein [Clostridium tagluense]MCB2331009.1 hypothetical protein [Clostridium tagluense]
MTIICSLILISILAGIGAWSKSKKVSRIIFVLGFGVCAYNSHGSWIIFIVLGLLWIGVYSASIMNVIDTKGKMYLANKFDETNNK